MIPEPGSFTTPTPRTDDHQWLPEWNGMGSDPTPVVDAEFARLLERENAELHAMNLELSRLIVELPDRIKAELDRRGL